MSITSALSNANSGLAAAAKRASVTSGNIANALTEGYSRREVNVSEIVTNGQGGGVQVDGVSRAGDQTLTNDRRISSGKQARDDIIATTYASFNNALGETDDAYSLFGQFQNLESSLRLLSETPESQPYQSQTLDAATSLTQTLNDLSKQAVSARQNADAQIAQKVDSVNSALEQIANLNKQISTLTAGGHDASALEDQRKQLIDQVSDVIPIREVPRGNNKIDLMTNEGVFLITGQQIREIEFTPTNLITADSTYPGDLSGLSVAGTDITPGGGGALSVQQGSLAGLFEVRDEIAPKFQAQLDGLARDLIERFQDIDPTLSVGDPGLFTDAGAAFNPANETGLAGRIAVNAAVDPNQGGAVWRLRDGLGAASQGPSGNGVLLSDLLAAMTAMKTPPASTGLSGDMSAAEAAANITSAVGASRLTAESRLAASTARTETLSDAELAASSVDTDAEMQKLLLIQQAYAANARVIQTASDMIQTLLEL